MKLKRVEFTNFKLLDGVVVNFSTDKHRPLTVVRAENGSGKTSLMWGLFWAFFGDKGLPAKGLRLTSTAQPAGVPVFVSVEVIFEHDGFDYILVRSLEETPSDSDSVAHGPETLKLLRREDTGEVDVPGAESYLRSIIPLNQKDIFITDGDAVQKFIAGQQSASSRKKRIKDAIHTLLRVDSLTEVDACIKGVAKDIRSRYAEAGGDAFQQAENALKTAEANREAAEEGLREIDTRLEGIEQEIDRLSTALAQLGGIEGLDALNKTIATQNEVIKRVAADEARLNDDLRRIFKSSDEVSWALAGQCLGEGLAALQPMRQAGDIPGTSLKVLRERIEMGKCICGDDLHEGSPKRATVEQLIADQEALKPERERATELLFQAEAGQKRHQTAVTDGSDLWSRREEFIGRFNQLRDERTEAQSLLQQAEQDRSLIKEDQVRSLNEDLEKERNKRDEALVEQGNRRSKLEVAEAALDSAKKNFDDAEKQAKRDETLGRKNDVADDLEKIVRRTIERLETEYLEEVTDNMSEAFLEIVGADPKAAGGVFRHVVLTDDFDIRVEASDGRSLNPDFEVNGASQRALTLSFIWSLMNVSQVIAPRVIDTPLGMTAGSVKRRMVDVITRPVEDGGLDYQVVLLLTRSEIRDIEDLLDQRMGSVTTLTCSKDFPKDIKHDWGVSEPAIRNCSCSHRQFCDVCERRSDAHYQLAKRV